MVKAGNDALVGPAGAGGSHRIETIKEDKCGQEPIFWKYISYLTRPTKGDKTVIIGGEGKKSEKGENKWESKREKEVIVKSE